MKVAIEGVEWYPVYIPVPAGPAPASVEARLHDVPAEQLERWQGAIEAFQQAQSEMQDLVSPKCPECGHRQIRHQEHSPMWDNWGCLDWFTNEQGERTTRCRCRHGCPPERLAELMQKENDA